MNRSRHLRELAGPVRAPLARLAARVRALVASPVGAWAPAVMLLGLGLLEITDAGWSLTSGLAAAILLATLPLGWRRRHPVGVAYLVAAGSILATVTFQVQFPDMVGREVYRQQLERLAGEPDTTGELLHQVPLLTTSLTLMFAVYLLVRYGTAGSRWLMATAVVGLLVALASAPMLAGGWTASNLVVALVALVAASIGEAGRTRSQLQQERAASMARIIAAERRQAIMTERARIARELHDVVAHSVSVIAVRAEVSPYSIPDLPPSAQEGFQDIARSARGAMGELRQLLNVLRGDSAAELAPQPSLDRLEELLRQHQEAGGGVELHVRGSRRALGAPVELSAYRIVQEALTNTRKHAPAAHARVEIGYHPDRLTVRVTDDGPGPTGRPGAAGRFPVGHGLLGMRERASILGGELTAGPGPCGGFEVAAELPLSAAEPTSP